MEIFMIVIFFMLSCSIIQLVFLLVLFHFQKSSKKEKRKLRELKELGDRMEMDGVKITGTKGYMDIEYDGCTARFNGELCVDGFYAYASSLTWIKWNNCKGHVAEEDKIKIMHKAQEYESKYFRYIFLDDNDNELNLLE